MSLWDLIPLILIIILIIMGITIVDVDYIRNANHYWYAIMVSACIIISLVILVSFYWFNRKGIHLVCFTYKHDTEKYKIEPHITKYVNVAVIFSTIPILEKIIAQIIDLFKQYKHIILDLIITSLDVFSVMLVYHIYFFSDFHWLTHGMLHRTFPYILASAFLSLIPFCLSVLMYILTRIDFVNRLEACKTHLPGICLSALIESLSMLGISLAFDALSYPVGWFVSVGLMYWGTYFFIIISLTLVALKAMNKIRNEIIY